MKINLDWSSSIAIALDQEKLAGILEKVLKIVHFSDNSIALSVAIVPNKISQEFNLKYRGKDKPADVLSFTASDKFVDTDQDLGEIIIASGLCKQRAQKAKQKLEQVFLFLLIHGLLHLLGYQHDTEDKANIMEELQESILKQINVRS